MTKHILQRMSQRGIRSDMVSLVCQFGEWRHDKLILGRDRLDTLIAELASLSKVAKKVRDKGGMVVVEKDGAKITTYNFDGDRRKR